MTVKTTTVNAIYQSLLNMITSFDIAPGFRLTENQLAEYFEVSRTPIRAALQRLENEGHVFVRAKQGCFVRNIDLDVISDYYDIRIELEIMTVRLAAQIKDKSELEILAEQWRPELYFYGNETSPELKLAEETFHVNLAEISGNRVLPSYLHDINDRIRVVRQQGWPDQKSVDDTYTEHFNICQYLLNDQVEKAVDEMVTHIKKSKDQANRVSLTQIYRGKNNPFA
jgi:DNA-binding GntR family transcriptional regulator